MKIAFLGYDFFFGCLETIVANGHEFLWLYTYECDNNYNFNERVVELANKEGAFTSYERITPNDIKNLKDNGCDLIISAAYKYKIPCISNMPRTVNIHPSLLPEGRGPWPLPHIILKDLECSGVTIHKVESSFDSGEILIQDYFTVDKYDNLETLASKSQILAKELLTKLLIELDSLWINSIPQIDGSYWEMPNSEQRTLNWKNGIEDISKKARAFGKFDSFAIFDNKEWIIQDLDVWKKNHNFAIGSVVHRTDKEIVIAASDGLVCIRYYKIDSDFVNEKN